MPSYLHQVFLSVLQYRLIWIQFFFSHHYLHDAILWALNSEWSHKDIGHIYSLRFLSNIKEYTLQITNWKVLSPKFYTNLSFYNSSTKTVANTSASSSIYDSFLIWTIDSLALISLTHDHFFCNKVRAPLYMCLKRLISQLALIQKIMPAFWG